LPARKRERLTNGFFSWKEKRGKKLGLFERGGKNTDPSSCLTDAHRALEGGGKDGGETGEELILAGLGKTILLLFRKEEEGEGRRSASGRYILFLSTTGRGKTLCQRGGKGKG